MIITGHLQRQPLMIRGRRDGRDVPFNRQDIYIGMRYLVPALGELLRQGEEKWVCPKVVEENFQAALTNYYLSRNPCGSRDHPLPL